MKRTFPLLFYQGFILCTRSWQNYILKVGSFNQEANSVLVKELDYRFNLEENDLRTHLGMLEYMRDADSGGSVLRRVDIGTGVFHVLVTDIRCWVTGVSRGSAAESSALGCTI